jgi:hypothetical protein
MSRGVDEMQEAARRLLVTALRDPCSVAGMPASRLDALIRLARHARLHARLAADLKRSGSFEALPRTARDQLESALAMADARDRAARWELDRIASALAGRPLGPLLAVKGCAYLLLDLPNRRGRIFADVDLLVSEGKLASVEQRLNQKGWKTRPVTPYDDHYYRAWTHELPPLVHLERDVEIDLHHNILPRTARLTPEADYLLASSVPAGESYRVPCPEDLVIHAMVHLTFDSDLADKLRDLVDIDDLIRHYEGERSGFLDRLADRAEQLGLERPVFYALRYVQRLLETPLPRAVEQRLGAWAPPALVLRLMDRLAVDALIPLGPDEQTRRVALSRTLLFMRSHWLRMPPWLLARHLGYKLLVTRLFPGRPGTAADAP